jgi:hypothetical protein
MSASTHFHKLRLRDLTRTLEAELPDLSVWVGGAAFISENEDWDASELLNPADILGDARTAGSAGSAEEPR